MAAAAAVGLVTGMAAATGASAAPASKKLAPGAKTSNHKIKPTKGATPTAQGLLPKKGNFAFLLKLNSASTSTVYARTKRSSGTASAKRAAHNQLATVTHAQNSVIAALPAKSHVLYRTHAALAGVAVITDVKNYGALRRLSGVSAVYPISTKRIDNSYAVPYQGGAAAWEAYGDLGQNSTVAIIDTGVDYTHANFGGPGTVEAYDDAKDTDTEVPASDSYDHSKFNATTVDLNGNPAYMYDFAGDDYNANPNPDPSAGEQPYQPVPHPDPNPLDCTDHGSHVAGTAAGFGEDADGDTYRGTYDTDTPFDQMRIGPGVAPKARIYAYKVFGCSGSTDVTGEAIDKAMDPNGDGDTSDHADVVNMSLGSDYGFPDDGDSVLTNEASQIAGVTMVVASGNGGDVYDIGGSPGNAVRSIAVANSQDAYSQVDALTVSAPESIAGDYAAERSIAYDWATKSDLAGDVARVSDPSNLEGCDPLSDTDAAAVNGKIAFVDWTDDDNSRPCGSVKRSGNLAAAGAIGFIFGDDAENFSAGITGSTTIPGVLVSKTGADAIRAELVAGHTVTISGTTANGFRQIIDGLNDTVNTSSSRGIRDAGNVKPDVTAIGTTVFSTGVGTGNQGLNLTGTSMATPMVAGTAALVKSKHPDWTPDQVKADIMNTADADLYTDPEFSGDKYAPNRVGTGRIDIKAALDNTVLAYTVDGPGGTNAGNVSASFGPLSLPVDGGNWVGHKTIRVTNTGQDAVHYEVGFEDRTTIPGATYTVAVDGAQAGAQALDGVDHALTVEPHQSATVTLTLTIDPTQLTKTIDPTVARVDSEDLPPRQYVADVSGLVTFTSQDEDGTDLRVPAYAAPRPASHMSQPSSVTMPAGSSGSALLPLTGAQVQQGHGDEAIQSLVAGFELQAKSGAAPKCSNSVTSGCWDIPDQQAADIRYVGSTSDAQQLTKAGYNPLNAGMAYFSITSWAAMRHVPSPQEYDIYIDSTGDGVPDAVVYTTRIVPSTQDTDIWVAELVDLTGDTPEIVDDEPINAAWGDTDTAAFDTDTFVMPVWLGGLPGLTANKSRISYAVFGFDGYHSAPLDNVGDTDEDGKIVGGLSMDVLHPGVSVAGSFNGNTSPVLFEDAPGTVLAVTRNNASYLADKALGAEIVHFHNAVGAKAQLVSFKKANPSAVSLVPSATSVKHGTTMKFTVTVAGSSGTPTGTVTVRRAATSKIAGGVLGTVTLVNGKATLSYTPKLAGTFKYTATYNGDAIYNARSSLTVTVTVT